MKYHFRSSHQRRFVKKGVLNPIQDELFRGCSRMVRGGAKRSPLLPKICHTYPAMIKLGTAIPYLKNIKKYMNHVTHPLSSTDINNFSSENSKFSCIKKLMYRLHFESLKIFFSLNKRRCFNKKSYKKF